MAKKRKNEVIRIDLSSKADLKVIPSTEEEIRELQQELENMYVSIQERMEEHEAHWKDYVAVLLKEDKEHDAAINASYYIEKYDNMVKNKNQNNIKSLLERYYKLLSEDCN